MGAFEFKFKSVGGHGCQRDAKQGETFVGCRRMGCPDCECKRFVDEMRAKGFTVDEATFTHWPGQPDQVVDDLTTPYSNVRVDNDFFNSKNKPPAG